MNGKHLTDTGRRILIYFLHNYNNQCAIITAGHGYFFPLCPDNSNFSRTFYQNNSRSHIIHRHTQIKINDQQIVIMSLIKVGFGRTKCPIKLIETLILHTDILSMIRVILLPFLKGLLSAAEPLS